MHEAVDRGRCADLGQRVGDLLRGVDLLQVDDVGAYEDLYMELIGIFVFGAYIGIITPGFADCRTAVDLDDGTLESRLTGPYS